MSETPVVPKTLLRAALGALSTLSLLALAATAPSSAAAQGRARQAPSPVVELDPVDVEGRAHGPGAFYLLERARSAEATPELRRRFVREIVESVRNEPF